MELNEHRKKEISLLIRFLKEKRIYETYRKYLTKLNIRYKADLLYEVVINNNMGNAISGIFAWYETDEGINFWTKINMSWEKLLNDFYNNGRKTSSKQ